MAGERSERRQKAGSAVVRWAPALAWMALSAGPSAAQVPPPRDAGLDDAGAPRGNTPLGERVRVVLPQGVVTFESVLRAGDTRLALVDSPTPGEPPAEGVTSCLGDLARERFLLLRSTAFASGSGNRACFPVDAACAASEPRMLAAQIPCPEFCDPEVRWLDVTLAPDDRQVCGDLGLGEPFVVVFDDRDADGVGDARDNCPRAANADQTDDDSDGRGDVCDSCPHTPRAAEADEERCDGLDNDCDGEVDEGLAEQTRRCGRGACAHAVSACSEGAPEPCDPLAGAVEEICDNGADDDCDGRTDEGCAECARDRDCDDGDPCSDDACSDEGTCTSVPRCVSPDVCIDGTCEAPERGEAAGAACDDDGDCATDHCVDGMCCEAACDDACLACARELTGERDGTCAPALPGADPHDDCEDEGEASCGRDGACDGEGACRFHPEGTTCRAEGCEAQSTETPDRCDGLGRCIESAPVQCEPGYACVGFACRERCDGDADCLGSHHCVEEACVPDLPRGAACEADGHCASTHCVDGVCCDGPCAGTCRACAARRKGYGVDGLCEPVAAGSDPSDECEADAEPCGAPGLCDGSGSCQRHASRGTACGATRCEASRVRGSICDGEGRCVEGDASCGPYPCAGDACADDCERHADCEGDAFCTRAETCAPRLATEASCGRERECASGACEAGTCLAETDGDAPSGECTDDGDCEGDARCHDGACMDAPHCLDAETLQDADGETVHCFEYACVNAACLTGCDGDAECAEGHRCVRAQDEGAEGASLSGRCIPAAADEAEASASGSGGCEAGPGPGPMALGCWLGLLAMTAYARAGRRRTGPKTGHE